jgi:hypothetical protein
MFGSNILEVAIGIVLIYLLASLFCTAVNESIAATIQRRGKNVKGRPPKPPERSSFHCVNAAALQS